MVPLGTIPAMPWLCKTMSSCAATALQVEELRNGLKAKGQLIPEADLQRLVASTDVNGNGTIDYEEFLAATIHQSKLEKVRGLMVGGLDCGAT